MKDYCECQRAACPVCGDSTVTISHEAQMRAAFEADANSEGNLYNLTPMPAQPYDEGQHYWSLHTQRAWELYQKAFASAARIAKENNNG